MKKLLSLLLVCLFVVTAAGCGGADKKEEAPATAAATSAETEEATTEHELSDAEKRALLKDNVPDKNYNGKDYNILSRVNFAYEFDSEMKGDVLSDALYERNAIIEDRFNVKIKTIALGTDKNNYDVLEDANKAIAAGDDAYTLLSAYRWKAAPGSLNGGYVDLYTAAPIDFAQPWWCKDFVDEASINGRVYLATGALSILFQECTLGVFFNKKLASDLKLGDLYSLVRAGDWTLDKLIEYSALAARDANGDGKMDENDVWGVGVNRYTHVDALMFALDIPMTARDKNGIPQYVINSEKMVSAVEKIVAFLRTSDDAYVCDDGVKAFKDGMFENNQGLFMTSWLGNAATLREMEADFGIIPYPKWDKAQENYQTMSLDRASTFLIPVTADKSYSASIAEAMACQSYKTVVPAFYDTALKTKYARDDESQEMIEIILEHVVFDFADIYSQTLGGDASSAGKMLRTLVWNKDPNFASKWASVADSNEKLKNDLIAKFEAASQTK